MNRNIGCIVHQLVFVTKNECYNTLHLLTLIVVEHICDYLVHQLHFLYRYVWNFIEHQPVCRDEHVRSRWHQWLVHVVVEYVVLHVTSFAVLYGLACSVKSVLSLCCYKFAWDSAVIQLSSGTNSEKLLLTRNTKVSSV